MVYFDKYKYEKIDFEKVAFFLLLIVYTGGTRLEKLENPKIAIQSSNYQEKQNTVVQFHKAIYLE